MPPTKPPKAPVTIEGTEEEGGAPLELGEMLGGFDPPRGDEQPLVAPEVPPLRLTTVVGKNGTITQGIG